MSSSQSKLYLAPAGWKDHQSPTCHPGHLRKASLDPPWRGPLCDIDRCDFPGTWIQSLSGSGSVLWWGVRGMSSVPWSRKTEDLIAQVSFYLLGHYLQMKWNRHSQSVSTQITLEKVLITLLHSIVWCYQHSQRLYVINKADVFFWNSFAFSVIQLMLANWSLPVVIYGWESWTIKKADC